MPAEDFPVGPVKITLVVRIPALPLQGEQIPSSVVDILQVEWCGKKKKKKFLAKSEEDLKWVEEEGEDKCLIGP